LYASFEQGGFGLERWGLEHPRPILASARKWPTTEQRWELANVPHHGVHAAVKTALARLYSVNATFRNPAALTRIYTSLASQGVDTAHNKWWQDRDLDEQCDHIEWLNKVAHDRTEAKDQFDETLLTTVTRAVDRILAHDPTGSGLVAHRFPNISEATTEYAARVLGLASVAPRLAFDLIDVETGQHLTLNEVAGRLGDASLDKSQFAGFYPNDLIKLVTEHNFELPKPERGVIPDYLLPVVEEVLSVVSLSQRSTWAREDMATAHYTGLLRRAVRCTEYVILHKYKHLTHV
jgi:hypothetical protein